MTTLPEKVAELKRNLENVTIDGTMYFVAEGDLLLDENDLDAYAERMVTPEDMRATEEQRLLGMQEQGKIIRWKPGLVLTYRVIKSTFTTQDEYDKVRREIQAAADAWQNVCGISFQYLPELDEAPDNSGVLFAVQRVEGSGRFIAAAFFPSDPPERRIVKIDPSFFTQTTFSSVGILRHELGHVLGFRHEHIRSGAPAQCPKEKLVGTIALDDGKYDPKSVMHYFCGNVGSKTLELTEVDIKGAQRLYGRPLSEFSFKE